LLIKRCIATFFILLVSFPAISIEEGKWALDINLASIHQESTYGDGQKYNRENFGLGTTYGYSDNIDFKLGFFNNSYNRTTTYLVAVWQKDFHYKTLRISPGIGAFLVTGYDRAPEFAKNIQPGAIPVLSVAYRNTALNIGLLPSAESNHALTFQLQIGF
jgi:hypothetical protein